MTKSKKIKTSPKTATQRVSNKDKLLELLRGGKGASLVEITQATGWLPHSARAMLTGLRKKGFGIGKERIDGVTRYAISEEPTS